MKKYQLYKKRLIIFLKKYKVGIFDVVLCYIIAKLSYFLLRISVENFIPKASLDHLDNFEKSHPVMFIVFFAFAYIVSLVILRLLILSPFCLYKVKTSKLTYPEAKQYLLFFRTPMQWRYVEGVVHQ